MKKYVSKLHYLTHDLAHRSHCEQARMACEAGANWVQYRCLTKTTGALLDDLREIAIICDDWGATLIVTDHAHLLGEADVQGVHLENMHADLAAVRRLAGDDRTIGASANTFEDIVRHMASGAVDYIGCGPFRLTNTKPNDFPLLGVDGYRDIIAEMEKAGVDVPLLAVGGVTATDVLPLLRAGVYGVAVSAAVNEAAEPGAAYKELHRVVY